ncbi:MFS transporter [Rothia sp. AR01]|uniref:MFS transporter n=1 Tax=Rothia santali TaxID=2949643 RepID=A0A9X2HLL0_9MICC|nr:MFS transporter [Rothia santali]MCP3427188.1 MFS transporter [Rothia santali]
MSNFSVIDDAPKSSFHRRLLIACCGGPFLDGYIISLIGVAMTGFLGEIPAGPTELGLIGASGLIGIFFGATFFGALTDKIGREKMYALDLTVLVVACALSAFVGAPWQLIALRFIIGLAIGADYPIATSLLTEFTPKKSRGFMIGLSGLAWSLGAMTAFLVGFLLINITGEHPWRIMLASGAVLGVVVVLMRRGIPESPRWLADKGRLDEARKVLTEIYGAEAANQVQLEPARPAQTQRSMLRDLALLVKGGYWKRTLMCGMLYFAQITPQYALYTFGAVILSAAGLPESSTETLGELLIAALFAIGILPALKLVESVGRRPMTVIPFVLMSVSLGALALWVGAPPWFIVLGFFFYAFVSGGPSILQWIYPNELFPTEIRATAVGVAVGFSRIGAATGTYLVPVGIATIGINGTLGVFAIVTVVALVICYAWAPETRGRSLAETSSITTNQGALR